MSVASINPSPGLRIDPVLFAFQLDAFRAYIKVRSGLVFNSFASNPYTEQQEGYKFHVCEAGRAELSFSNWTVDLIGTGEIIDHVISAIELESNNLVKWRGQYGPESRQHQPLYDSRDDQALRRQLETALFELYRGAADEQIFSILIRLLGKRYSLLAYLMFLKDRSKYLPTATTYFDKSFEILGSGFRMTQRCSWTNYQEFIALILEVRVMLSIELSNEVTLLDAHSFVWFLSNGMTKDNALANTSKYVSLPLSEREAIIQARVGQGQYRQALLSRWGSCSVTGCANPYLLRASHIKPWRLSTTSEKLDVNNGLLLSPALDSCFDAGYISFTGDGTILISPQLSLNDALTLGINKEMKLTKLPSGTLQYLGYHRDSIFRKAKQD